MYYKMNYKYQYKRENTYSLVSSLFSKHFTLLDLVLKNQNSKKLRDNGDIKPNKLLEFIKCVFKYSKIVLTKPLK